MASSQNYSARTSDSSTFQNSVLASSRPFLNTLNPMGRKYQGYTQANHSLVEEQESDRSEEEGEEDLETGRSHSTVFQRSTTRTKSHGKQRVSWNSGPSENVFHPNIHQEDKQERDSSDDDVPVSFMIETAHKPATKGKTRNRNTIDVGRNQPLHSVAGRKLPPEPPNYSLPHPVLTPPRISEIELEQQPPSTGYPSNYLSDRRSKPMRGLDAYERALWNWVNVYNLDAFLQEVYYYYEGKGVYCIALARGLNLLTVGFVICFSTFLLGCIDYSHIRSDKATKLSEVVVSHCVSEFSGFTLLFFILFTAFYVWQIITFTLDVVRLVDMYNFYTHLLGIPDADIQTISWQEVVRRIGAIREENPLTSISSKSRHNTNNPTAAKLDAHDIANRIMRQENYLIALFNKDLLDLRVPLPQLMKHFGMGEEGKGKVLTKALEWNLRFCLMEYLFDKRGRVRKVFLKSANRAVLVEGLKRRFIFMGVLNALFAPFIVLYLLMYSFFRYFEEYHKNPSSIGGRRYTSFAQWKFREFNELPHFFIRRLDESYPVASMYIGQFPNEKITLIMRFVAFIAGSFAAVLVLATVLDPDLFVHFEITPHRTVLFYLGVFGSVLAVARGMIPDENRVFDPEILMTEVITYTHYMPEEWKGKLHSKKVHQEFGELFAMKVMIFAQELISVVLTPFVLWFSLPDCAPAIIDFFREFTVHVDGRGYVCSFAEFDFERHGNVKFGAPGKKQDKRFLSNQGKMEKSFLNFKATNPEWNPSDPSGSLYLSRMAEYSLTHPHLRRRGVAAMEGTALLSGDRKLEVSLADRAQEYDRALRQSQFAASTRRRGTGLNVAASNLGHSSSSAFDEYPIAQTAVLGDSQGSVLKSKPSMKSRTIEMPDDDMTAEGEIADGLEGSYVDGAKRPKREDGDQDEDGLEDGGILGLLAEIYGRREGAARAI